MVMRLLALGVALYPTAVVLVRLVAVGPLFAPIAVFWLPVVFAFKEPFGQAQAMAFGADYLAAAAEQAVRAFLAGRINRQP